MDKKVNFIKTKDIETKEQLENEGFTLLSSEGGVYTFLNDSHLRFSDSKKYITTNTLYT